MIVVIKDAHKVNVEQSQGKCWTTAMFSQSHCIIIIPPSYIQRTTKSKFHSLHIQFFSHTLSADLTIFKIAVLSAKTRILVIADSNIRAASGNDFPSMLFPFSSELRMETMMLHALFVVSHESTMSSEQWGQNILISNRILRGKGEGMFPLFKFWKRCHFSPICNINSNRNISIHFFVLQICPYFTKPSLH